MRSGCAVSCLTPPMPPISAPVCVPRRAEDDSLALSLGVSLQTAENYKLLTIKFCFRRFRRMVLPAQRESNLCRPEIIPTWKQL